MATSGKLTCMWKISGNPPFIDGSPMKAWWFITPWLVFPGVMGNGECLLTLDATGNITIVMEVVASVYHFWNLNMLPDSDFQKAHHLQSISILFAAGPALSRHILLRVDQTDSPQFGHPHDLVYLLVSRIPPSAASVSLYPSHATYDAHMHWIIQTCTWLVSPRPKVVCASQLEDIIPLGCLKQMIWKPPIKYNNHQY